ncbi:MAG: helix-turn-helix domain-containing protein [Fusicatenibacter sp.]|nr:AraC family transcriptional regulator [Fusicatenibacter sp.]
MPLDHFNPVIQDISVNKTARKDSPAFSFGERTIQYYELERIASSYGQIRINEKTHHLEKDDVFLRKPGQTVEGFMPYRFQYLTFQVSDPESCSYLNALPDKLNLRKNPRVQTIFDEIQLLFLRNTNTSHLLIKARILELICLFSDTAATCNYSLHVKKAISFMEAHYDQNIGIADIADSAGISVRYLFLQFRTLMSDTPVNYLNQFRLEKSKTLLLDTELSISEIALRCGFQSLSYFDYVFKTHTGSSPASFRRQHVLSGKSDGILKENL